MKRKIAILLALLLLVLPVRAFAVVDADLLEISKWELSEDEKCLTYMGEEYRRYYLNPSDRFIPTDEMHFDKTGVIGARYVRQSSTNDEVAVLMNHYDTYEADFVYATQTGAAMLDRFMAGEYGQILFMDEYLTESAEMTMAQVQKLDELEPDYTIDVTELANVECYPIIGMDETGTFGHLHGAVYTASYAYFYINYDALDNSYFSSDGEFSYRSGTVDVVRLEGEAAQMVAKRLNELELRLCWATYESDEVAEEMDPEESKATFWFLTVILGLIVPAVPLTFGLIYALRGKCLYPKRWYVLVALSVAWMVVMGVIVLLVMR